eukprot:gene33303-40287_t
MVVIPTILNTLQFWVTDTFIKKQHPEHSPLSSSDLDEDLIAQASKDEETSSKHSGRSPPLLRTASPPLRAASRGLNQYYRVFVRYSGIYSLWRLLFGVAPSRSATAAHSPGGGSGGAARAEGTHRQRGRMSGAAEEVELSFLRSHGGASGGVGAASLGSKDSVPATPV